MIRNKLVKPEVKRVGKTKLKFVLHPFSSIWCWGSGHLTNAVLRGKIPA